MWILYGHSIPHLCFNAAVVILLSWIIIIDAQIPAPKLFGKAIAHRDLDTRYDSTKKKIVLIHNFYRARVNPPASDMLEMSWHKGAEETAQRWAGACQYQTHDKPVDNWVQDLGSCGQNIFTSDVEVDWMHVAKAWYMEHQNFSFGKVNNLKAVGHYTQMVWYDSHRIGCGFKHCRMGIAVKPFFNYVCNYCPIGNEPKRFGEPYSLGQPCGKCHSHCKYRKLCTNPCHHSDLWSNCADLNKTFHTWLCGGEIPQNLNACKATCKCPNSIR